MKVDDIVISPPDRAVQALKAGQQVTVGIRPSDLRVARSDDAGPAFDATVEVAEFLGTQVLLALRVGGHELIAEIPAQDKPAAEHPVRIAFDSGAIHLFDTASGVAI